MPFAAHALDLDRLAERGRLRRLALPGGVDFSSNDYLALAGSPRLAAAARDALDRGVTPGSGGSRLLRGHHPEHEALEREAAAFFGAEAALFFGSGYAANQALFATLPQTGDLVVRDALVHASARDGMRLGRAEVANAAHNDAGAFDDAVRAWRRRGGRGAPWIAAETLYSMDGDRAPLPDLLAVAERHDGVLVLDEAHATGAWGPGGRGLAHALEGRPDVLTLHTLGKAAGCEGAVLCGPRVARDFLVNRARPFVFSTAPSPLAAAVAREALRALADEPERRDRLHALVATAGPLLARVGATDTGTQVMPLLLGADAEAVRVAAAVQAAGFDARAVRPPAVPEGTARLRVSLTLHASAADAAALADAIGKAM